MQDRVSYYHVRDADGLVLSDALVSTFQFERHFHLDYHIGFVVGGCQRIQLRGETALLTPGRICLVPPGELHAGRVEGDQPYLLKTFRVSPNLLDDAIDQVWEGRRRQPLDAAILDALDLATDLANLHGALAAGSDLAELSVQSHWLGATARLFSHSVAVERQADGGLCHRCSGRVFESIAMPIWTRRSSWKAWLSCAASAASSFYAGLRGVRGSRRTPGCCACDSNAPVNYWAARHRGWVTSLWTWAFTTRAILIGRLSAPTV